MNHTHRLSSEEIATYVKVMSDPTRLLIIKLVSKKEYCVCQFVDMFEMSQPSISQHLKKTKKLWSCGGNKTRTMAFLLIEYRFRCHRHCSCHHESNLRSR